jgi:four helix bundle protein
MDENASESQPSGKSFEDLRVFQEARGLANLVYTLTRGSAFSRDFALADQMRRAALSIVSNIAEGYERGSDADFARFLFIAKGSCGELRAQTLVALDQKNLSKEQYDEVTARCRRLSVSLYKLIAYLRKSVRSPRRRS